MRPKQPALESTTDTVPIEIRIARANDVSVEVLDKLAREGPCGCWRSSAHPVARRAAAQVEWVRLLHRDAHPCPLWHPPSSRTHAPECSRRHLRSRGSAPPRSGSRKVGRLLAARHQLDHAHRFSLVAGRMTYLSQSYRFTSVTSPPRPRSFPPCGRLPSHRSPSSRVRLHVAFGPFMTSVTVKSNLHLAAQALRRSAERRTPAA